MFRQFSLLMSGKVMKKSMFNMRIGQKIMLKHFIQLPMMQMRVATLLKL